MSPSLFSLSSLRRLAGVCLLLAFIWLVAWWAVSLP
jgi:hypothetical protein